MNGTFENALVKVAYKVSRSGQIGFKFRGKFELPGASLVAMNNEFKLYFSTVSGFEDGGRVLINTEISKGAFLSEKKFMALLGFFKNCAEIVSGRAVGRESIIENDRYIRHKTHKIFMLCEALDGIKTFYAEQAIEQAKKEAEERALRIARVAQVVKDCDDWNILWNADKERIEFVFQDYKAVEKLYWYDLPDGITAETLTVDWLKSYWDQTVENYRITAKVNEVQAKYFGDNPDNTKYYSFPSFSLDVSARVMNFLHYRGAVKKETKKMIFESLKNEGYKIKFSVI